jgi:beta-glucanase (GH16 family)
MKRVLFLLVLISLLFTCPLGVSAERTLVFSDEFNSLDLSKWRPNWLGPSDAVTKPINSSEVACYDPRQVSVTRGELILTAVKRSCAAGGKTYRYSSGMVQSDGKFNFVYGLVEARIWTPAGEGVWPAFWTDGQSWPEDGEIDILEAYGTDESTFHYHYAGCGGDCGPGGSVIVPGATSGWHTYAVDWSPGLIVWLYDGVEVWRYSTSITDSKHFVILNLGLRGSSPTVPSVMRVDWVRVWQGSSAATATRTSTRTPTLAAPTKTVVSTSTRTPTLTPAATVTPTRTPDRVRVPRYCRWFPWLCR